MYYRICTVQKPSTQEVSMASQTAQEANVLLSSIATTTGLMRSLNTSILFLPAKRSGLALPPLVSLYKKVQSTRMVPLMTSRDAGVRKAAELYLKEEKRGQRCTFRSGELVGVDTSCTIKESSGSHQDHQDHPSQGDGQETP